MPSGRKNFARTHHRHNHHDEVPRKPNDLGLDNGISCMPVTMPKHVEIPPIPLDGSILFELVLFLYTFMSMLLQYVNLYRTVWWLPHSHTNYSLNFYLIDPYIMAFITSILGRRLIINIAAQCFSEKSSNSLPGILCQVAKWSLYCLSLLCILYCSVSIIMTYPLIYCLYLSYPFLVQVFLVMLDMHQGSKAMSLESFLHSVELNTPSKRQSLHHACSTSPENIREEVEILKTDFNCTIKHILFSSLVCAYYAGFIPCCFAQSALHYDVLWACQHVLLLWINCFILFSAHYLTPHYCDTLHRAALHLGKWQRAEGRHAHVPYNVWSELQIWPQNALVKHVKGLFRSEGNCNAAEPGNLSHARFYILFHKPLRIGTFLGILQLSTVLYQLFTLINTSEWHNVLSIALLLFFNYYILLTILRDYFLLSRAYKDEGKELKSARE